MVIVKISNLPLSAEYNDNCSTNNSNNKNDDNNDDDDSDGDNDNDDDNNIELVMVKFLVLALYFNQRLLCASSWMNCLQG